MRARLPGGERDGMLDEAPKLNLLIGTRCNNRCVFCLDRSGEPDDGTTGTLVASSAEAVAALRRDRAAGGPSRTGVALGRLEPALDRDLLEVVRAAKALGYETIQLTSNGRVLSNRAWAEALAEAGVNLFTISVHAPSADVHDRLSGRPRAFEQTVRGLENLVAIRRERPLVLSFGVTVTALNLPLLTEHYAFLLGFTPRLVGLNALLYSGRASDHVADLSFPYADLEAELLRLLAAHRGRLWTRLAAVGVPFCALSRVPAEVVGLREAFRMPSAGGGGGGSACEADGADAGGDAAARDAAGAAAGGGAPRWVETGAAGESGFGVRPIAACARCAMRPGCPGVSAAYVLQHGADDLRPLDEAWRKTALGAPSLFPGGAFRFPVRDPAALPPRVHALARGLAHAAAPEWRLVGVSAFSDESQTEHRLGARFRREPRGAITLDVEPRREGGAYFRTSRRWGVTLADDAGITFDEPTARARERLVARLLKTLTRLDETP
jgi:MoaA/NifB/PqqE/SkfB family radical SAM enzyme